MTRLPILALVLLAGCAALPPPGADFPRPESFALAHPEKTRLGRQSDYAARAHGGNSGFRALAQGVDGFLARVQMIDAAERTLDLQYYIFRNDKTGKLLGDALLRAADRGTRVRLLVDDGDTVGGDEDVAALAGHPGIEIRVFNPFSYRGHSDPVRLTELMLNKRLDHRMHNKLLVVDNSIALIGGRNVGDAYFQLDADLQFADYDLFVLGPIVRQLSGSFDEYWNSALSIPAGALAYGNSSPSALAAYRRSLEENRERMAVEGAGIARRLATGQPLAALMSGAAPLAWARAELISDSPAKVRADSTRILDQPLDGRLRAALAEVKNELLMVTPFFVPGTDGLRTLQDVRRRNVKVRLLTNSLESSSEPLAHAGYMRYRMPALESGVELFEVRARPDKPVHAPLRSSLHAKLYVFDRRRVYIGSMNFDQRSFNLNTEIGLLIDSPELAREAAARFETMANPRNSYRVTFEHAGKEARLRWTARVNNKLVYYDEEPDRTGQQGAKARLFSLLPLDGEL